MQESAVGTICDMGGWEEVMERIDNDAEEEQDPFPNALIMFWTTGPVTLGGSGFCDR